MAFAIVGVSLFPILIDFKELQWEQIVAVLCLSQGDELWNILCNCSYAVWSDLIVWPQILQLPHAPPIYIHPYLQKVDWPLLCTF